MTLFRKGSPPGGRRALIGVVHLEALPGAPRNNLPISAIEELALQDAIAWKEGGADAVLVENFGDAPFPPDASPPETIAFLATIGRSIRRETGLPLGINILRNDGEGALAAAIAAGGTFIRVNILTHAYLTDQGVIEGIAHRLLRRRAELGADVEIWADLLVKHAVPLTALDPGQAVSDLVGRGGADAVIMTGSATGAGADPDEIESIVPHVGDVPIIVGSGVTPDTVDRLGAGPGGFIVGTWCKSDGRIDRSKVEQLAGRIHKDSQ